MLKFYDHTDDSINLDLDGTDDKRKKSMVKIVQNIRN